MKKSRLFILTLMVMLMLSAQSAWADTAYVKLTAPDESVSWIEIQGTIDGTDFEVYNDGYHSAIYSYTYGIIDLNEVWSDSDGTGTHYQVTSIGNSAFRSCFLLKSVIIPEGVTSIGEYAFYESLYGAGYDDYETGEYISVGSEITIPSSVTSIGYMAFAGSGLGSIIIPSSVTTMGMGTFIDCKSLSSVTIQEGVTTIGGYGAFMNCDALTSITIPSSVTTIEAQVFDGSGLTSISIPSGVTNIGVGAFSGCPLTSISVEEGNEVYDSRNDCNAIVETATNTLLTGCMNSVIPETVTSIGPAAFLGCEGLTEITIPSSITSIGYSAFYNCDNLAVVNSEIEEPFEISDDTFSNYDATLNIPDGTYDKYISVSSWNQFKNLSSSFLSFTVTDAGYATLYFDCPLSIPDDSNIHGVYYGESIYWEGYGFLQLEEISGVIPAHTGVVISAEPGTYTFYRSNDKGESISNNLLQGSLKWLPVDEIDGTVLTLGRHYYEDFEYETDENPYEVGFFRYSDTTALEPYKAFIVLPNSSEVKSLRIVLNNRSTGIDSIENANDKTFVCDMTGRKYSSKSNLSKGMYIMNGKKVFIK